LYSILLQHTNSPRVGLDSHFSGESVSFRDYTLPVKIDMSAPARIIHSFIFGIYIPALMVLNVTQMTQNTIIFLGIL
jgi:hypothetical protein